MYQFRQKQPILYSIVAVGSAMLLAALLNLLLEWGVDAGLPETLEMAGSVLVKLIPIIIGVTLLALTKKLDLLRPRKEGFLHGLACGAFIFGILGMMVIYGVAKFSEGGSASLDTRQIIIVLIYFLIVGIGEEILARAISAQTLLEHFGFSKNGVIKACILSGVIFGAMHFVNLFQSDVLSVLAQVLTTSGVGMLFGVIYFRSGNLWSCIVLHMIFDASLFIVTFVPNAADTSTTGGNGSLGSLIFFAALIGVSFFLLRKSKISEVQSVWESKIESDSNFDTCDTCDAEKQI